MGLHLGFIKRGLIDGTLSEDKIERADETHVVVNLENEKTLGMIGDRRLKYAEVI